MKVVTVIQARMGSTRLPGKVMMNLGGAPVLEWCVRACRAASGIDEVVIATTTEKKDDIIANYHWPDQFRIVRGSETDVLSRFVEVQKQTGADVLLRITGDEPFVDPAVISAVVRLQKETGAEYCSNIHPRTYPDGLDVEAFTASALFIANETAIRPVDRDTVTYWMVRNQYSVPSKTVINPIPGMEKERWVLDTYRDMAFIQEIVNRWPWHKGPPSMFDILNILDKEPELRSMNSGHVMNERFFESLLEEVPYKKSHINSRRLFINAKETIPLGCQTFSKSYLQFPGKSPLFLTHGKGAYVYDVDGNEYVDCVSGLLPVILGYCDNDVDNAIRHQLNQGISFSLATELEQRLSNKLCRMIPGAEMTRFGKNGSDVTSAAVRLSRAYTGRDYILSSGYHGWPDTFVGGDSLRGRGVPDGCAVLTKRLKHGDSDTAIRELMTGKYACVIVEPETNPEFLQVLRDVCTETGTVLIFDEIITFPRWGLKGAQGLFGIAPDLTTVSKAIGNGMPISAICGKREIMKLMEPPDNIFYSGTFQGETLSIAAALACLTKLEQENVIPFLHRQNDVLNCKILKLAQRHRVPVNFSFTEGLTRLSFSSSFEDQDGLPVESLASLFRQTMAANGVLIINSNNLTFSHKDTELKRVEAAYDAAFAEIRDAIDKGDVEQRAGGRAAVGVR